MHSLSTFGCGRGKNKERMSERRRRRWGGGEGGWYDQVTLTVNACGILRFFFPFFFLSFFLTSSSRIARVVESTQMDSSCMNGSNAV